MDFPDNLEERNHEIDESIVERKKKIEEMSIGRKRKGYEGEDPPPQRIRNDVPEVLNEIQHRHKQSSTSSRRETSSSVSSTRRRRSPHDHRTSSRRRLYVERNPHKSRHDNRVDKHRKSIDRTSSSRGYNKYYKAEGTVIELEGGSSDGKDGVTNNNERRDLTKTSNKSNKDPYSTSTPSYHSVKIEEGDVKDVGREGYNGEGLEGRGLNHLVSRNNYDVYVDNSMEEISNEENIDSIRSEHSEVSVGKLVDAQMQRGEAYDGKAEPYYYDPATYEYGDSYHPPHPPTYHTIPTNHPSDYSHTYRPYPPNKIPTHRPLPHHPYIQHRPPPRPTPSKFYHSSEHPPYHPPYTPYTQHTPYDSYGNVRLTPAAQYAPIHGNRFTPHAATIDPIEYYQLYEQDVYRQEGPRYNNATSMHHQRNAAIDHVVDVQWRGRHPLSNEDGMSSYDVKTSARDTFHQQRTAAHEGIHSSEEPQERPASMPLKPNKYISSDYVQKKEQRLRNERIKAELEVKKKQLLVKLTDRLKRAMEMLTSPSINEEQRDVQRNIVQKMRQNISKLTEEMNAQKGMEAAGSKKSEEELRLEQKLAKLEAEAAQEGVDTKKVFSAALKSSPYKLDYRTSYIKVTGLPDAVHDEESLSHWVASNHDNLFGDAIDMHSLKRDEGGQYYASIKYVTRHIAEQVMRNRPNLTATIEWLEPPNEEKVEATAEPHGDHAESFGKSPQVFHDVENGVSTGEQMAFVFTHNENEVDYGDDM